MVAPGEVGVALSVGDDGGLAATVSVADVGPAGAPAVSAERGGADVAVAGAIDGAPLPPSAGAQATLEVWTLPLDPALSPYLQASVPLPETLGPAATWTVPVGTPAIPAVVVGRIVVPGAVVAALPTVALADRGDDGRLVLRPLAVASPRDELLLGRSPAPATRTAPVTPRPGVDPGSVEVAVSAGDPAPMPDTAVAAVEEVPGPHSVLVRTLSVDAGTQATPTGTLVTLPADATGATRLALGGIPAGVRLVMAGLVPRDGGPIDPATISPRLDRGDRDLADRRRPELTGAPRRSHRRPILSGAARPDQRPRAEPRYAPLAHRGEVPERFIGAVLKTAGPSRPVGSNPTLSARFEHE